MWIFGLLWMAVPWVLSGAQGPQIAGDTSTGTSVEPTGMDIRLADGPTPYSGRLEVRPTGVTTGDDPAWGTVCDDRWDNKGATVACRQLGYVWGEAVLYGKYGRGTGSIYMDEMKCEGTEASLLQCRYRGWGNNDCAHAEDAGAICHNNTVRLQSPSSAANVGVVQVLHMYKWADVCDTVWDTNAASITCRQLGYTDGIAECCSTLGPGAFSNVDYSLTVACNGTEPRLSDCTNTSQFGMCDYSHRAAVVCYNTTADQVDLGFDVRISGGERNWGQVQVRHDGVWGQVCNNQWDDAAANVTCRQLGQNFTGGVAFGPVTASTLPRWLPDIHCTGNETSLEDCKYSQWGEPYDRRCHPAYVLCYSQSGVSIDIVEGRMPSMGRVQITYDGAPGSICTEEWTDNDARIVCRQTGFADGKIVPSESSVGPYYLNSLICNEPESILMCSSLGWRRSTDKCTSSAYVMCNKGVRLVQGRLYSGILEIQEHDAWIGVCHLGFTTENARLACKEFGMTNASVLPLGSYGKYYNELGRPFIDCKGNESSLLDCDFPEQGKCSGFRYQYVAINCFNGAVQTELEYRMLGPMPDSSYGHMEVRKDNLWGEICAPAFRDKEADVFCKTIGLSYIGGVATSYRPHTGVPVLLANITCTGNETVFTDCPADDSIVCYSTYRAGAVCYQRSAPKVRLADGGKHYGRVMIDMDGQSGSVCDAVWTQPEASVVCREIDSRYTAGEPYRIFPSFTGDVFLSDVSCDGYETSLLTCANSGWRYSTQSRCLDHSNDVGVYCYGNVRLVGGNSTSDFISGRVELMSIAGDNEWISVCADGFDQVDANVVCSELGFDTATVLAPGSFGLRSSWKYYTNMTCAAGGADTHANCSYMTGTCSIISHNYAALLCRKSSFTLEPTVYIESGSHGTVYIEQYGMNGTVCTDGWDDVDAAAVCRQKGYKGGVVLGVPEVYSRTAPIWYTNITCSPADDSLLKCKKNATVPLPCSTSLKSAGVLCYKDTGVQLRLVNDEQANYYGRVEVELDGITGTVCDYAWSRYDAMVTCRQLGFPDGVEYRKSHYGAGSGPVYLSGLTCDVTEKSLLACPHMGWGWVYGTCGEHTRDASVLCKRHVLTDEADTYGAVRLWQDGAYNLVCSDGFTDADALVVCRTMGYPASTPLCCSAFGAIRNVVAPRRVACSGRETNYNDCVPVQDSSTCQSKQYASVVCSKQMPEPGFSVGIRAYPGSVGTGPVVVNYRNQAGHMCSERFDDADADVICRQLGHEGGFAFKEYNGKLRGRTTTDLRWLRGPNCTGSEHRLELCSGIDFGNVTGCSVLSRAAVVCRTSPDQAGFEVRLVNTKHPAEGLVQVKVNGTWGSVCTLGTLISDYEATVICRQLNFKYGIRMVLPDYEPLNGTVWLTNVHCTGDETDLRQCMLAGLGSLVEPKCLDHHTDLAVKCYSDVRLSAAKLPNYGMVQVLNESANKWEAVCDDGFDDSDARVICRTIGYRDGVAQCCSSLGSELTRYNPIHVVNVSCTGDEPDFSQCPKVMTSVCRSRQYASAVCTNDSPPKEDLQVSLPEGGSYGHVEVTRYGVRGSVCDVGWDDRDATVLCRSLDRGFTVGYATNGSNTADDPMLMTSVNCSGGESSLAECDIPPLSAGHECNQRSTRAGVICSTEPVHYRVADVLDDTGRAEIYVDGEWGTICDLYWEDADADVFCRQAGYVYGEATTLIPRGADGLPIYLSHVECTGREERFLQCMATWDAKAESRCSHYDDAGVRCYRSVRLNRGDYRTKKSTGIVETYVPQALTYRTPYFTVCRDTFTDREAAVVCRSLGHDNGLALCCSPYGYSTASMARPRPRCLGTEAELTDCEQVLNQSACSSMQNYASVVCYNGSRTTQYSLSLKGSLTYTGQVVVKYLGVSGRICWTGWDDADARVVCRELGFQNGSAYYHYKSNFIYLDYGGPYWTSGVDCTGNESSLGECQHMGFGNVSQCEDQGHFAGVICYDTAEMYYRLSGGNDRYGRVEFSHNDHWYGLCSYSWGYNEANVMCRQLGYTTGDIYNGKYSADLPAQSYMIDFRCAGSEGSLNDCPHEGLQEATYCQEDHNDYVGVFCYTSVKLQAASGSGSGSVLYYHGDEWAPVCDAGFDDTTARRVCRDLGFADGRAICCSAYGQVVTTTPRYSLHCEGGEGSIGDCLRNTSCTSGHYASVVCSDSPATFDEDEYTFDLSSADQGQIEVTHFGVKGRICSRDWDDTEATVFCRGRDFQHGIAYQHWEGSVLQDYRGPYWLSGLNCSGDETSLLDCPRYGRLDLGNCTDSHIAAVLCYNESGIEYRLAAGEAHYGRVEISVGGQWGTICDQGWDRREAGVFCRQMNFTDGEAIGGAHFGPGKGKIWLSHLKCRGTEGKLHQCPHEGFLNEFSSGWWFPLPCETHADDAGVFCYKSVRLSKAGDTLPPRAETEDGGLELFYQGQWYGVCDVGFDRNAALVACRSINPGYVDARAIPGSAYGALSGATLLSKVTCEGSEVDMTDCSMTFNATCQSGHYASVYCSNRSIEDTGFAMRLATDSLASPVAGILEVRVSGVWGRVCLHNFDDVDAGVACKQLGFNGGVAYLHIMKNDGPVLMRDVVCNGLETSIDQCENKQMSADLQHCHYGSNDAGLVCYNDSKGGGFTYRLNGGSVASSGRAEIGYAGAWGMICSWSWQTADARVLCQSLGYVDGIVSYVTNTSLPHSVPWVTGFFCKGNETSLMTCLNTGFNSTFLADLCQGRKETGGYAECYPSEVVPTRIRLVGGRDELSGRVEVFVTGADRWGTVCDDYWDDDDARVVCRQLGLYGGKSLRRAPFGEGTGPIWFDNMKCFGNETSLFDCNHRGVGTHNCNHTEDVGVICEAVPLTTKPTTVATTPATEPETTRPPSTTTTKIKPTKTTTTATTTTTIAPTTTAATTAAATTTKTTSTTTTTTASTTTTTTTTKPVTTQTYTTTLPTTRRSTGETTMHSTTLSSNETNTLQQKHSAGVNTATVVAVPIVVVILIVVGGVVIFFVVKRRREKNPAYNLEGFDDSIVSQDHDGTISAHNQMYGIPPPSSSVAYEGPTTDDDKMAISKSGSAYYSKCSPNRTVVDTSAFTNPLYEANRDLEQAGAGDNSVMNLSSQEELSVPDRQFNNNTDA